jgi:hypothetical protein
MVLEGGAAAPPFLYRLYGRERTARQGDRSPTRQSRMQGLQGLADADGGPNVPELVQ